MGKGPTRTASAVVRPVRWLSLHAHRSDSFQPASPALNLDLNRLPDPAGKGEDYGFSLTLFTGRLVLRANQYSTKVIGTRAGTAGTINAYPDDSASAFRIVDPRQFIVSASSDL